MSYILVVEDEIPINELVVRNLKMVGHTCDQAFDGKKALEMIRKNQYDLIVLDVMLPYLSGFELMEHIEKTPVIFLTAKYKVEDKVKGLTAGAEDYIVKPFEMLELIARVDVVLRRYRTVSSVFSLDETTVDLSSMRVTCKGKSVELTPQEYALLNVLISNRNIALSREKLLELAWGFDYEGDTRTVDVHVQKIRKKLCWAQRIATVYKLGYRLEV